MVVFYNIIISLYAVGVRFAAIFLPKAAKFVDGRKGLFKTISNAMKKENRSRIWFHCASLGEFEQARPLIEKIKKTHPNFAIILTFFSPSGYEVRKDYANADYVFYLPLDSKKNASKFIAYTQPSLVLFAKYEFWYHYLFQLKKNKIQTFLFSAIFLDRHPFFKWYGSLHRNMLQCFDFIFVQDEASLQRLKSINIKQVAVAGDTRFDRVLEHAGQLKDYPQIKNFKAEKKLLIAGSTWLDDEQFLLKLLPFIQAQYKLLIVPHEIDEKHISAIKIMYANSIELWSASTEDLQKAIVCIVNSIGHLSSLYRYADAAWIGGGFTKTGVHNVLESAVYGVPTFWGDNYKNFLEAQNLIVFGGGKSINEPDGFSKILSQENLLKTMGNRAVQFVQQHAGATLIIYCYLEAKKCFLSTTRKL